MLFFPLLYADGWVIVPELMIHLREYVDDSLAFRVNTRPLIDTPGYMILQWALLSKLFFFILVSTVRRSGEGFLLELALLGEVTFRFSPAAYL